jgi:hypothetical protein
MLVDYVVVEFSCRKRFLLENLQRRSYEGMKQKE